MHCGGGLGVSELCGSEWVGDMWVTGEWVVGAWWVVVKLASGWWVVE